MWARSHIGWSCNQWEESRGVGEGPETVRYGVGPDLKSVGVSVWSTRIKTINRRLLALWTLYQARRFYGRVFVGCATAPFGNHLPI